MSATASSMRKQAPAGAIALTISYLEQVELGSLRAANDSAKLNAWLDEHTNNLTSTTFKCVNYGGPRKVLNIFLKEIYHNRILCDYISAPVISHLEIPLDNDVAAGIVADMKRTSGYRLPKWPCVKHLTPHISSEYQMAAAEIALIEGVVRVDLDLKYWRRK